MRSVNFVVISLNVAYGFSFEAGQKVSEELERRGADWWQFLNPDSFIAFFASDRDGKTRADRCRIALQSLRPRHECLRELRFGEAEGPLIAAFDWRGRITAMPLGGASNEAMRRRG